jgi:hypothetical protein
LTRRPAGRLLDVRSALDEVSGGDQMGDLDQRARKEMGRGYGFTADERAATAQERAAAVGRKLSATDLDAVIGAGCRNAGGILHDIFGRR